MLAGLCIFALFLFPLVHGVYVDGKPLTIMVTGVFEDVNGQSTHTQFFTALAAATAVVAVIPLGLIFLYSNRKQQIMLSYIAMVVVIGYSFWMSQTAKGVMAGTQINTNNWGIGLFLSSISLVFLLLAISAIKRDEKLVKSADRLR